MKRCTECGFVNQSDAVTCIKCGSPLAALASEQMFSIPGEEPSTDSKKLPDGLRMTIRDTGTSGSYLEEEEKVPPPSTKAAVFSCPNCWFTPLRELPSAEHPCPNCGYGGSSAKASTSPKEVSQSPPPNPKQTVMLQDLVLEDEEPGRFRLINERSKGEVEFHGNDIVLNRGNLDPNNSSLSGQEHAKVTRQNGMWYLEDLSSNQATFIQVRGKIELKAGDRLILGNKIFRFDPES